MCVLSGLDERNQERSQKSGEIAERDRAQAAAKDYGLHAWGWEYGYGYGYEITSIRLRAWFFSCER